MEYLGTFVLADYINDLYSDRNQLESQNLI